MSELSHEFELFSNIIFSLVSGVWLLTLIYDMLLHPYDIQTFFGCFIILGFFTFYPLINAVHWYREIKASVNNQEVR